jgi:hypothetical protein
MKGRHSYPTMKTLVFKVDLISGQQTREVFEKKGKGTFQK